MHKSIIAGLFEFSAKLLRKARIPLYSSKFSKKTYTQHQHMALLVLKTYVRADYMKTCQLAEELRASEERGLYTPPNR